MSINEGVRRFYRDMYPDDPIFSLTCAALNSDPYTLLHEGWGFITKDGQLVDPAGVYE